MEDNKMNKRPDKPTELGKSEYVKDKEKQAAEQAELERQQARKTAKKEQKSDKKPLKERIHSQKFRHGAAARTITVLGLVLLVLVNVVFSMLSSKFPSMNADLTTGGMNSLSDSVKKVVDGVNKDTNLIIIGTEEQVRNNQILSSYNIKYSQVGVIAGKMAERNHKITVSYKDLDKDPTFASKYSKDDLVSGDVVVKTSARDYVVKYTDLFNVQQDSQSGAQQVYTQVGDALASGISNANSENRPIVAFDTGHESQLPSEPIKKLYSSNNFESKDFNLMTDKVPDNTQLIFIGAPKTDYTDAEIKKLDEYLSSTKNMKDRGLLVSTQIIDPAQIPKLSAFLKEWGITLENKVALESDASKYAMQQPAYLFAQAGTDVTLNKNSSYQTLLTPVAQTMTLSTSVSGVTVNALIKTNNSAYTVSPKDNNTAADGKAKAASVIAALSRKAVTSGSNQANASVVVCGSSMFFADGIINTNSYSNGSWSADLARYITGNNSTGVTITPVQTNTMDISLSSASGIMLGLGVFTIILPLVCFIIGIVVYRQRRKL
jgi:hypothetical protein